MKARHSEEIGFEQLEKDPVGPGCHDVLELSEVRDLLAKLKAQALHVTHQAREVGGSDAEVMHDPAPTVLWRLIVEVDVCRSKPKKYVTRSGHFVVEHHLRPEHLLIEADRGSEVARKEMRMVKVASDERFYAA